MTQRIQYILCAVTVKVTHAKESKNDAELLELEFHLYHHNASCTRKIPKCKGSRLDSACRQSGNGKPSQNMCPKLHEDSFGSGFDP
mmetsp:Transcript_21587/g.40349  ORF Transcript_21587/g.40349 Transcript_21587/m.40349 type:complete len:86 (+) Transcript_21587:328-585(+)